MTEIDYKKRDSIWKHFGCRNYHEYLQKFLVKGNFHPLVPKDIVNSFRTVEYLIAHAYYYYPMYDEALTKVMRTMEMGVRIHCKQLNIATETKNKKGEKVPIALQHMIDNLIKAEPEKDLNSSLAVFKYLRNSLMHPERHSYMGGMSQAAIIRSVNTVNELFAPRPFFTERLTLLNDYRQQLSRFYNCALELDLGEEINVLQHFELADVFHSNDKIHFCLYMEPVPNWSEYNSKDQGFLQGFSFYATDLKITEHGFTATNSTDGSVISITLCVMQEYLDKVDQYNSYLKEFFPPPFDSVQWFNGNKKYQSIADFRRKHYPSITEDSKIAH